MKEIYSIKELMIIYDILRTRSLSTSAGHLGIAQTNLSRALRQFEENGGLKIFERSSRPMKLTPFGKELIFHIDNLLKTYDEFCSFIYDYKKSPSGYVKIHAPASQLIFLAKHLAPALKNKHPEVKLKFFTKNILSSDYIHGALFENDCDILFTHILPKDDMLIAKEATLLRMNVYATKSLIQQYSINNPLDYTYTPCILYDSFMNGHANTWIFFDKKIKTQIKVSVDGDFICDNAYSAIELAKSGLGYVYIPEVLITEMNLENKLYPSLPDSYTGLLTTYTIYRRKKYQSARVEAVLKVIDDVVKNSFQDS